MTHTPEEKQAALTAAIVVYGALVDLWQSGFQGVTAAADLVRLCRREIRLEAIGAAERTLLQAASLLDDGELHASAAAVVCRSVVGEGIHMQLVQPPAEELAQAWLDPDAVLGQYAPVAAPPPPPTAAARPAAVPVEWIEVDPALWREADSLPPLRTGATEQPFLSEQERPIQVVQTPNQRYWLVDGIHCLATARSLGWYTIWAYVTRGSYEEAQALAIQKQSAPEQ